MIAADPPAASPARPRGSEPHEAGRSVTPTSANKQQRRVDLSDLAWINVDGAPRTDLEERYMLLFFWSQSSVPCLQSLSLLEQILPRYEHRLLLIAVHCPRFPRERDMETVRCAVNRLQLRHPVVHDPSGRLREYHRVRTLPSFVMIHPDGQVARHSGEPDPRKLRAVLDQLLAGAGSTTRTGPVRVLTTGATPVAPPDPALDGPLRYPTTIKPMPGAQQRWAIADCGHHQVVLVDDEGRERLRFGSGVSGCTDGRAHEASFRFPRGLVCSADAIYVADTGNHCIRRIDVAEKRVTTVAGTGHRGYRLPWDPRAGRSMPLASPWDFELDGSSVYFSNAGSNQLGLLDCLDGTVVRLAGNGVRGQSDGPGRLACLAQPSALALDDAGDRLFFVDSDTGLVRSVTLDAACRVDTLHGPAAGQAAALQYPLGLVWADDRLLVADSYNDRLLALDVEAGASGRLVATPCVPEALARLPALREPEGVWAEDTERMLIVDTGNHRIVHFVAERTPAWESWPRPPADR